MHEKIIVKDLYKVFGENPKKAMAHVKKGVSKPDLLQKHEHTLAVNNVNFSINEGEIFVIMGLSGSGKSTLVRMFNKLIGPTEGTILIDGENLTEMHGDDLVHFRRKKISMVFQSFALMPHMSILENTSLGLEFSGVPKEEQKKRALSALDQVGLAGWENSYPDELSGGMKQRVGLARALATSTEILLMDEAFSALDPLIRSEMQDELIKLHKKDKRTIIFISHDLDEALKLGDRIAIMHDGEVVQVGAPDDILLNPADDYVRAFFKGVDPTMIITAKDIASNEIFHTVVQGKSQDINELKDDIEKTERDFAVVLDDKQKYVGLIHKDQIDNLKLSSNGVPDYSSIMVDDVSTGHINDKMQKILPEVASNQWPLPIIDRTKKYYGVVTKNIFLNRLNDVVCEEGEIDV